ncbi:MAG: glycosyltransferase family 39 protein [Actinobacteria bacterium]|nr:glycosyltransferase family 39 protein [Actinomycetota bacterium]
MTLDWGARRLDRHTLAHVTRGWAVSRTLCWAAGIAAVLVLGSHAGVHDPSGFTTPFGKLGNVLVAPAARWDTTWYLLIADHGYATPRATAFFPLYPLAARVAGAPFDSSLVGGIIISLAALFVALYFLERLAAFDLGVEKARRSMLLLAFFPAGVFLSAVYGESLLLALSIAAVYAARRGRWSVATVLGGLAAACRPTGFLLMVPLVLLYLYGPRGDRQPPARPDHLSRAAWLRPRYPVARDAGWFLVLPLPFVSYMAYAGLKFHDFSVVSHQNKAWNVGFTFPLVTAVRAVSRAISGATNVVGGHLPRNIFEVGVFCLSCVAAAGVLRRLPFAYGAYVVAGILFVLCFPIGGANLSGYTRYMAPLFPLLMWTAAWATERGVFRIVLGAFALVMTVDAARFASWHFVG